MWDLQNYLAFCPIYPEETFLPLAWEVEKSQGRGVGEEIVTTACCRGGSQGGFCSVTTWSGFSLKKKKKKKVMPVFYNVLFQQRESSRERTGPWKSKAWNSSFLSFHFKQETSRLRGSGGSIGCVFILRQIMFVCCKCQWFIPRA